MTAAAPAAAELDCLPPAPPMLVDELPCTVLYPFAGRGHAAGGAVTRMTYSRTGRAFASVGEDGFVNLTCPDDHTRRLETPGATAAAFSWDERYFVTVSPTIGVSVYNAHTGAPLYRQALVPTSVVCCVPHRPWMVDAGPNGHARVWSLENGQVLREFAVTETAPITDVCVTGNGKFLCVISDADGAVAMIALDGASWDVRAYVECEPAPNRVLTHPTNPNLVLVCFENEIEVWCPHAGGVVGEIVLDTTFALTSSVVVMDVSSDGAWFVLCVNRTMAVVCPSDGSEPEAIIINKLENVESACFIPGHSDVLVVGAESGGVYSCCCC